MGLDLNSIRFLAWAKRDGVSFDKVLMFGRQSLDVFPAKLISYFAEHGISPDLLQEALKTASRTPLYSEPVFLGLGAKEVSSLDASNYESATIVHDMNLPISDRLKGQYDLVYDGGSLEHVFNVTVALKNCMELVKPGGRLIFHTPTTNYSGHGFYQFSPEFFYRALTPENGYQVERMVAHPIGPYGSWYEVLDPERIRQRVELIAFYPVMLLVQAKRIKECPMFEKAPQQSDYRADWEAGQAKIAGPPFEDRVLSKSAPALARLIRALRTGAHFIRKNSLGNRATFRRIRKP